ncbi:MAG: hypothetical protein N2439_02905 [Anaerolineae bacterium]|nr:hypothetical protein [Anaerolineae bacterium]
MKRMLLLAAVVLTLVAAPLALAAIGADLSWHVFSGGGGGPVAAGSFTLHSSVGQSLAGAVSAGAFGACAGFWCRPLFVRDLFLPLILR